MADPDLGVRDGRALKFFLSFRGFGRFSRFLRRGGMVEGAPPPDTPLKSTEFKV